MKYKHTEQELREAVEGSSSLRQVMLKLGIAAEGGNYRTVKERIQVLRIDTGHFTGQSWSKGKRIGPRRAIEELFSRRRVSSDKLRQRIIKAGLHNHSCDICGGEVWMGQPIPLHLHHVDGDHSNNSLNNLQILCPNCHSQTETYCRKK